jgi:hypothetical protein
MNASVRDGAVGPGAPLYLLPILVYGLVLAVHPPDVALIEPDSDTYVHFGEYRTAGYPLFISAARALGAALEMLPLVQLTLSCAALAFLGWATARVAPSRIWAPMLVLAILVNPFLAETHFQILTESLFITLTMVIVGLLALYLHAPGSGLVAMTGVAMGLAIATRPTGYAFLPLLPVAALLVPDQKRWRRAIAVAIGLAAAATVIGLEMATYHERHGPERRTLLARHLFAKAGLVEAGVPNPYPQGDPRRAVWQALDEGARGARSLIREAPSFGASAHIGAAYELELQYRFATAKIQTAASALAVHPDDIRREVAFAILSSAPRDYLGLTWHHYVRSWTLFAANHPRETPALADYLASRRPLPLDEAGGSLDEDLQPSPLALFVQPAVHALWLITIAVAGVVAARLARRRAVSAALATAAVLSLMVNGNFALVSLTGNVQPRYTLAMWPAMIACAAFAAIAVWQAIRRRRQSSD